MFLAGRLLRVLVAGMKVKRCNECPYCVPEKWEWFNVKWRALHDASIYHETRIERTRYEDLNLERAIVTMNLVDSGSLAKGKGILPSSVSTKYKRGKLESIKRTRQRHPIWDERTLSQEIIMLARSIV